VCTDLLGWLQKPDGPGNRCPLSEGVLQLSNRDMKFLQYEHSFPGLVPHNQDAIPSIVPPCFVLLSGRVDALPQTCRCQRYSPIPTAACAHSICCLCVAPSQLCLISARSGKLLTPTLTILQGKQNAEHPTAETVLSDKLSKVQDEKKLLLEEINQILRAWREDTTRREEAAARREEVLIAVVCFANACCI